MATTRNCDWNSQARGSCWSLHIAVVIGEEAVKAFDMVAWGEDQSKDKIMDVLAKFDEYCEPRTQVILTIINRS